MGRQDRTGKAELSIAFARTERLAFANTMTRESSGYTCTNILRREPKQINYCLSQKVFPPRLRLPKSKCNTELREEIAGIRLCHSRKPVGWRLTDSCFSPEVMRRLHITVLRDCNFVSSEFLHVYPDGSHTNTASGIGRTGWGVADYFGNPDDASLEVSLSLSVQLYGQVSLDEI